MTELEWAVFDCYWQVFGFRSVATVYLFDQWFPDYPGHKPSLPMADLKSIGLVRCFLN